VNQAGYSGSIGITGGTSAFSNLTVTGLPAGLTAALSGNTITVSGTPTAAGTFNNINVGVTDAAGAAASGTFALTINPGLINTVAGNGTPGYSGDDGAATSAQLNGPSRVAVDSSGNLFIADTGNNVIREVVRATGNIITVAGNGTAGYSGDGGSATSAQLNAPFGLAVDASGDLFIADAGNNVIREVIQATGIIITVAGNGTAGYSGDGAAATSAQLNNPCGVTVDANGNVFIADTGNNVIREVVQTTGNIITVAGNGTAGYSGDGGPATSAQLNTPYDVAVDHNGNLFIADTGNYCIREVVQSTGNIITVAGNGTAGYSGDGGAATSAQLNLPVSIAVDASGNLFIADAGNNCVREVLQTTGTIFTVAGNGTAGYSGDGGLATSAQLNGPEGVAVDASGDLFVADTGNDCIRQVL
jgi:sugar lactone lactonase YvrE